LARQGFDYETAREAVTAAWQQLHADEAAAHYFDESEE